MHIFTWHVLSLWILSVSARNLDDCWPFLLAFKNGKSRVLFVLNAQSENARLALCEHPQWTPVVVVLGLLQCSIPPVLKAELLRTLAAFGKSPEIAALLWQSLEYTQVVLQAPLFTLLQLGKWVLIIYKKEHPIQNLHTVNFPITSYPFGPEH